MIALLALLLAVVNSPNPSITYACDGVTAAYVVNFPYQASGDLQITSTTPSGGVTTLAQITDWTVNLASTSSTATLTLSAPVTKCPSGNTLKIARNLALTQPTSFKAQTTFDSSLHERVYDRTVMQIQQVDAKVGATDIKSYVDAAINNTLTGGTVVQPLTWALTGDGSTSIFSIPNAVVSNANLYEVTVDGLVQAPVTDYTVDSGTAKITFVSTPALNSVISVRSFGYARALSVGDNTSVLATGTTVPLALKDWMSAPQVDARAFGMSAAASATVNSAALQAAIYSTGTTPDRQIAVIMPPGILNMAPSTISVPEGVMVLGAGRWKTKLEWGSYVGVGFQVTNGGTFDYPPVFTEFAIHGGGPGIDTGATSGMHIERIWFSGVTGVQISGTADITITDCVFDGTLNGVLFANASVVDDVLISRSLFSGNAYGIQFKNVRGLKIVGNSFRGDASHNIHIFSPSSSNTSTTILIAANELHTNAGLGAVGSIIMKLTGTLSDVNIVGNNLDGSKGEGILDDSGTLDGFSFVGNTIKNIGTDAISLAVGDHVSVKSNIFKSSIGGNAFKYRGTGSGTFVGNDIWHANGNANAGLNGAAVDVDGVSLFFARDNVISSTAPTYGFLLRSGITTTDANNNYVVGPTISAYNLGGTSQLGPTLTGKLGMASTTQANLGAPVNGSVIYCSDCTIANPCAAAGTGALAKRLNGVWVCN